jgi:hypothetical protein
MKMKKRIDSSLCINPPDGDYGMIRRSGRLIARRKFTFHDGLLIAKALGIKISYTQGPIHYKNGEIFMFSNFHTLPLNEFLFHEIEHYVAQKNFRHLHNYGLGEFNGGLATMYTKNNETYKELLTPFAGEAIMNFFNKPSFGILPVQKQLMVKYWRIMQIEKNKPGAIKEHYSDVPDLPWWVGDNDASILDAIDAMVTGYLKKIISENA